MTFRLIPGEPPIAVAEGCGFADAQEALDLMMTAAALHDCHALIVRAEHVAPGFFELRTGIAGEILQKASNYRVRLAIVGDFTGVKSKALRDFIYESNTVGHILFVPREEDAVARWQGGA